MPSRSNTPLRYTPLALDEYAIDFASTTARFNASTELTSGFVAPARTATPIVEFARSTRLPATTLPCLIKCSSESPVRITRSAASPRCSRFGIELGELPMDAPQAVTALCPVDFSNSGKSARYAALKPPEASTLISAARDASEAKIAGRTAAATKTIVLVMFHLRMSAASIAQIATHAIGSRPHWWFGSSSTLHQAVAQYSVRSQP